MKAIVLTKPGSPDRLELRDVEKPFPRDNEILVRVFVGTVTMGDVSLRKIPRPISYPMGMFFGFKAQKVPGVEFAGVVESVGKDVQRFGPGDSVFGTTTGLTYGANAEYVCVPEEWSKGVVSTKPTSMSFEEAAAVPVGGMTAAYILNKASIESGEEVLIYGASGSVGTYAVQLAKQFGASVTGVCSSPNAELVKSLGADKIVDYTRENFSRSGEVYDVIFDAVGKISRSRSKSSLKENGRYLSVKSLTKERLEDLDLLKELVEAGKIKAVIDRRYPLEQVAEAHRYVEKGHKRGNVVITVLEGAHDGK